LPNPVTEKDLFTERGELTDGDAAIGMLRQRRAERLKPQG